MMFFHHNSFNLSSFQLLRGSEHQRKLLEGLLQRGWKQVFFCCCCCSEDGSRFVFCCFFFVAARMGAGFFFGRIKISSICSSILFFHLDPHDVETQNCLFRPRTIRLTWKIARQCIQFHFPAKMPGFWDTF